MNPNNLDEFLDSNETATLSDTEVNYIYDQVVGYAENAVFAELDMLKGQLENVADELTDDWTPVSVDENDESFPDWQTMNKEILRVMEEARKDVIRSLTSAFERIKKFNEDQSRVTGSEAVQSRKVKAAEKMAEKNNQNGLDSKTFTVNEAKTFAKEHGVSGFNKVKTDITNIIKDNPDLSKNLQSVADTVYKYIYNDVPDALQDEAEMLADQLLEKYSGVITTEEQDKAMGRGPTDSKELKKAMDRYAGLESGKIGDFLSGKIGDFLNKVNKVKRDLPGQKAKRDRKFNEYMQRLEDSLISVAKFIASKYAFDKTDTAKIRQNLNRSMATRLKIVIDDLNKPWNISEHEALQDESYRNELTQWFKNRAAQLKKLTLKKLGIQETSRSTPDRSVGLESGIFDGIKKKIGDKIANQWNKENEKYRKELTEEIYRGDIRKYKEMLRQKFINWYSTNTEPRFRLGVNAKTYLDIYTKQVIKKIKLDLISLLTEDNSEKIESTIKRYVDDINKYSELLYSNVEKYMKDEEQR